MYYETEAGTSFKADTPRAVRNALENARQFGTKLRIFYGDRATGRDWCEEHDVLGYIGRSMGACRVPLLLARKDSIGGGALLDDCIVRIVDAGTKREIYRAENYQPPAFDLRAHSSVDGYAAEAWRDGERVARFKSVEAGTRWCAFMAGTRMAK